MILITVNNMLFFIIFGLFCVTLFVRVKRKNVIPLCDNYLPVIGHTHMTIGNTKKLLRTVKRICFDANKNGGVVIFKLGFLDYYVLTDPEDILRVANGTLRKHFAYQFTSGWLGDGLVTSSGETWKRHRKLLSPAFNQQMLNSFYSIFNSQARILVENIGNEMKSGPVDVTRLFKQLTLKILFLTAFGMEIEDGDLDEKYIDDVDKLFAIMIHRLQNPLLHNDVIYKLSGWKRKEDELIQKILVISNMVISKKKIALQHKIQVEDKDYESNSKSILELLLKGLDEDCLTDKEIREEVDTIIVAGYDTTSAVLTLTTVLLGSYPKIQDKVYEEIKSVFGDSDADVDKSIYPQLVYCEAVIKETLRLYPIVPITIRQTESEIKLRNCTIPAGSSCFLGIYGVNRHPVWGPDADTFRPERWLEPGGVPEDTNAFAAFSVGKRTCIGKTFALMAMKTALVHIIRRYKVTADISKVEFKLDVLMMPADSCKVVFDSRTRS